MIDDGEGTPGLLFRIHVLDLLGDLSGSRADGLVFSCADLVADHRRPYAAPVRQLGERRPILRGRRRIDRILLLGNGGHREPASTRGPLSTQCATMQIRMSSKSTARRCQVANDLIEQAVI